MLYAIQVALLGFLTMTWAAVLPRHPLNLADQVVNAFTTATCDAATVYSTVTVFDQSPATVTVIAVDSASIARALSSEGRADTFQVIAQSQARPTGYPTDTRIITMTNTAYAPGYIATEIQSQSDVYAFAENSPDGTPITVPVATQTLVIPPGPIPADDLPPQLSSGSGAHLEVRATCVEVDGGSWGTWCNNWDGSTTLTYTSWETTITHGAPGDFQHTTITTSETTTTTSVVRETPIPQQCGEAGPFQINFDDLAASGQASTRGRAIFDPIHHLTWGRTWQYGTSYPYKPDSGEDLAFSNGSVDNVPLGAQYAGNVPDKGFGAGPRNADPHYWFDLISTHVQCHNFDAGENYPCVILATAHKFRDGADRVDYTANFELERCPNVSGCDLREITFDEHFRNVSAVSFYGKIQGQIVDFYLDTVELTWYDNSCEAGLARLQH